MTFSSVIHDAPPVEGTKAPSSSIKPQQVLAAAVQDAATVASSGTLRDDHASTPPMGETRPKAKAGFNDTPDHIADSDDQPSPKLHKSESKCTIEQSDMTLTRSPSIFRMLETTPTVGDTPPSQPPSIPPDVAHKVVQHIIFRWMKSAVPLHRLFPPSPSASCHPLDTFLSTLQHANVALKPVEVSSLCTSFPPTLEPPPASAPCLNVTLLVDSVATKLFPIELLEFQLRKAVVAKATKTRGKCDVFKALNQLFDTPTTTDTSMSPRVHFVHCLDRFVRNVQFDTLSVEGVFRSLVQDTDFERGFRAIDADGSGSLSLAECTKYLQTSHQVAFPPAVLQDFLRRFDRDGDGSLNLDEFMACSRTETGISKQLKCEIPKKKATPPAVQFPIDVSTWTRMDVKKWLIYNVQVKTLAHKFAAVDGHMLLGWAVHPHLDVWLRDKYSIAQPSTSIFMGAINSVRRLTIQCLGLLEALEPTTLEIENKATAIHVMQSLIRDKWPHLTLRPFGSSENDLDIGVFFDPPALVNSLSWNDRLQVLASIASILTLHDGMELHQFIFHARVPLVKLWDSRRKLAIDISIGSSHAVGNTLLLKRYGEMDPRVRPLVFAVKHWAKQRGLNDASNGTLSSYGADLFLLHPSCG
ncbi:hypothetical protein DYB31_005675 [Aphanomyces astaci]|uniref:EF-hand domain-containing protein n=1 Tax=Aphanomyces astaci TaxID=112090 RepID=A0A397FVT5_APHAT|nr:hypothetical protein DYB31_005675 [Aphanomyces astaci]